MDLIGATLMIRNASLREFVDYYRAHSQSHLCDKYFGQLQDSVRLLERQYGGPVRLEDLSDGVINEFCDWLQSLGRAPDTVRNRRNAILCLWRAAFMEGILDISPRRIRKIKSRRRLPEAWTREEVGQLMEAAGQLPRRFNTNIPRAIWWQSLISAAWDSALRLGDLLALQASHVPASGSFRVCQHKTGDDVLVAFSEGTRRLMDACLDEGWQRELIWPLWSNRAMFYRGFRVLVASSGIRTGTFRWLRRSAITAVELAGGNGSLLAGHRSRAVTVAHYIDTSQLKRPLPPPL